MNLEDRFIELLEYNPRLTKKKDFNTFWEETIEIGQNVPLRAKKRKIDHPSNFLTVHDISYCGFDDTRICGWFITPKFVTNEKLPCIITFPEFGEGRASPLDYMAWVMMGICVLAVDVRMNGGESGNEAVYTSGMNENVTTLGLLDKNEYYYRAVYVDAIKAIDFVTSIRYVNPKKIIVHGKGQGAGIAMAVCALDKRPKLGLFEVPYLCNMEVLIEEESGPFKAISNYIKLNPLRINQVFETLSYFDIMNMAENISCEVFASVGLKDKVALAHCFFSCYNQINTIKQVEIYPLNGHDGAHNLHFEKELRHLKNSGILE